MRNNINEAIRLQLIQSQRYNTTDIPTMKQDSKHGMQKLPSITIVSLLLPTSALILIIILKILRLGVRKRNSVTTKQY